MKPLAKPISEAVEQLKDHQPDIVRVYEWAELMGYETPKKFARAFLRHYGKRPKKVMNRLRLSRIIRDLRTSPDSSHFRIARAHGLPDDNALNKFLNYHLDCSPSAVKSMSEERCKVLLEKIGSNFQEEI